jgi:hypothetical protein
VFVSAKAQVVNFALPRLESRGYVFLKPVEKGSLLDDTMLSALFFDGSPISIWLRIASSAASSMTFEREL